MYSIKMKLFLLLRRNWGGAHTAWRWGLQSSVARLDAAASRGSAWFWFLVARCVSVLCLLVGRIGEVQSDKLIKVDDGDEGWEKSGKFGQKSRPLVHVCARMRSLSWTEIAPRKFQCCLRGGKRRARPDAARPIAPRSARTASVCNDRYMALHKEASKRPAGATVHLFIRCCMTSVTATDSLSTTNRLNPPPERAVQFA